MTAPASPGAEPAAGAARRPAPDAMVQAFAELRETLQHDLHEQFRSLEQQFQRDGQRQRERLDAELHKVRQQLATLEQETLRQQQALRATLHETLERLRKEVTEALQRLAQDVGSALQQADTQAQRALEALRNEVLRMFLERDATTLRRHELAEQLIALGKQLQATASDDA